MTWTAADIPDLTGKVAVITGSNAGLGFHIASDLAGAGARVIMACRNEAKAADAANRIRSSSPRGTVETMTLDLADLSSVRAFSERLVSTVDRLDILGNNAGLMALDESKTVDGFETQFGVNHLGHFALTGLVLPLLLATPGSRGQPLEHGPPSGQDASRRPHVRAASLLALAGVFPKQIGKSAFLS